MKKLLSMEPVFTAGLEAGDEHVHNVYEVADLRLRQLLVGAERLALFTHLPIDEG